MDQKLCFKVRGIETIFFWFIIIFMIFSLVTETQAQQFPIGTYWVKNPNAPFEERCDFYWQVADCGINIVVGGERGSTNLRDILDEADVQGIQLIIDHRSYITQ